MVTTLSILTVLGILLAFHNHLYGSVFRPLNRKEFEMSHNSPALKNDSSSGISGARQRRLSQARWFLVALACMAMIANTVHAQKVTTDFSPGTDFSRYHTYTWGEGRPARDPLIGQRIVAGIEAQLAAKGLRKAGQGEPVDLVVVYQTATDTHTQINTYNSGAWGGWYWGMGGYSSTTVERIPVGQLIVDIADLNQKKFIWRGRANGTISSKPEKNSKMIDKALTKMFENFPPKAKK
jgi:uncharacterized protein DUF4136